MRNLIYFFIICLFYSYSYAQILVGSSLTASEETLSIKKVDEGENLSFNVAGPAGITLSVYNLPQGATFIDNLFSWTPVDGQSGSYDLIFYYGSPAVYKKVNIAVANTIFMITATQKFEYAFMPIDPDSDQVQVTITGAPSGSTVSSNQYGPKIVTWAPTASQIGNYQMMVFAVDAPSNGTPKQDTQIIKIMVTKLLPSEYKFDLSGDGKLTGSDYSMFMAKWKEKGSVTLFMEGFSPIFKINPFLDVLFNNRVLLAMK